MADFEQLNFGWLGLLPNPHHDGTTQQIDDIMANFETDNARLTAKAAALHQARIREDEVWLRSQVDPVVKQLEAADKRQDSYISAARYIIMAHAGLPDTEATRQEAQECERVYKDFKLRTDDAYGAESDKILQMGQNLQSHQAFLTQIGAWAFYEKAAQAATQVRQLLGERARTKGEFVKGEMKAARRQTDLCVKELYQTINAMMELMPSDALTALYTQLKGLERYARQYYIGKGKTGDDEQPTPVTPDTPDTTTTDPATSADTPADEQ